MGGGGSIPDSPAQGWGKSRGAPLPSQEQKHPRSRSVPCAEGTARGWRWQHPTNITTPPQSHHEPHCAPTTAQFCSPPHPPTPVPQQSREMRGANLVPPPPPTPCQACAFWGVGAIHGVPLAHTKMLNGFHHSSFLTK